MWDTAASKVMGTATVTSVCKPVALVFLTGTTSFLTGTTSVLIMKVRGSSQCYCPELPGALLVPGHLDPGPGWWVLG